MNHSDHPIFQESISFIHSELGVTGLAPLQQEVLERLIHTSGDFSIRNLLSFSPNACETAIQALNQGVCIFTDTEMAASGVSPMAARTLKTKIHCVLDWAPKKIQKGLTRTALGMKKAWEESTINLSNGYAPIVLIGSAPTALNTLLDMVENGFYQPSLIIGMPVGFIGVVDSKKRLLESDCPHVVLKGTRGGASMVAATANALLRAAQKYKN